LSKEILLEPHKPRSWDETALKLLTAATLAIDEGAVWSWSMRDIASATGVANNTFFRKFKSRDNFVNALIELWALDLANRTDGLDLQERLLPHLRWFVYHRERAVFLLAEDARQRGYLAM
jgi:hypothetical protein